MFDKAFSRRGFMGKLAAAGGAAGVLAAFRAGTAGAEDWCDGDPLVKVVTPGGSKQYVHITFSAPTGYKPQLQQATFSWAAVPTLGGNGTLVTVTSVVPLGGALLPFATRAVISDMPYGGGTVYDTETGLAGQAMVNTYTLNVK